MHSDIKYLSTKKCLLGLVLLVYFAVTFNQVVFEFIHALSHKFSGDHSYHSHLSDLGDDDHKHYFLEFSRKTFEDSNHPPVEHDLRLVLSVDKIPQICPSVHFQLNLGESRTKSNPVFNWKIPISPFLQSISPPPDLII